MDALILFSLTSWGVVIGRRVLPLSLDDFDIIERGRIISLPFSLHDCPRASKRSAGGEDWQRSFADERQGRKLGGFMVSWVSPSALV